ncbi:MAG: hypothetical protein ACFFDW_04135 [Candidatus Thorarchaeota archaeon]
MRKFRGNRISLLIVIFAFITINGIILVDALQNPNNLDNSSEVYVYYGTYIAVNSTEIMRAGSTIHWQFVGSNPNVDINVYALTVDEYQKFEIDPSTGEKEVLSYGEYIASGTFVVPTKALWFIVFYNVDDNMIGSELNIEVNFTFLPLNYWYYVGPSIAGGIIIISLVIFFYVRSRKTKGLPVFPKREKKEKVIEPKKPKTVKNIFRPSLVHYFRIISIFPTYTITNYCIMFCCCTLLNILFILTVGLVILPFWLFFRFFIFIKFNDEKMIMRDIFDERIVNYDEIVDVSVQSRYSQRITTKRKGYGSTSTSEGPANPHSITLTIKTNTPAYVTMDLKKFTYDQGVKIFNYLIVKIKEKQIDFDIQNNIHMDSLSNQANPISPFEMNE